MATSVVNPRAQFFANNGRPLIGGRIHTYVAGSSTRARTYKDAAKAQPNTNPIVLDGRGEAQIYLAEGVEYKFVVEDSKGALIYTQEPVYGAVWPNAAEWPSDATLSYRYMTEAKAAAGAVGPIKFYDTLAQAQGDLANLTEGDLVEISQDEGRDRARTRRRFLAGTLAFVVNLDQLRLDLGAASGADLVKHKPNGPGTKARPVSDSLDDAPISIFAFDGVGSGVDSLAGVNAALASGRKVFIPRDLTKLPIMVGGTVEVPDGAWLDGPGKDIVAFKVMDSVDASEHSICTTNYLNGVLTPNRNVHLHDLCIDSNGRSRDGLMNGMGIVINAEDSDIRRIKAIASPKWNYFFCSGNPFAQVGHNGLNAAIGKRNEVHDFVSVDPLAGDGCIIQGQWDSNFTGFESIITPEIAPNKSITDAGLQVIEGCRNVSVDGVTVDHNEAVTAAALVTGHANTAYISDVTITNVRAKRVSTGVSVWCDPAGMTVNSPAWKSRRIHVSDVVLEEPVLNTAHATQQSRLVNMQNVCDSSIGHATARIKREDGTYDSPTSVVNIDGSHNIDVNGIRFKDVPNVGSITYPISKNRGWVHIGANSSDIRVDGVSADSLGYLNRLVNDTESSALTECQNLTIDTYTADGDVKYALLSLSQKLKAKNIKAPTGITKIRTVSSIYAPNDNIDVAQSSIPYILGGWHIRSLTVGDGEQLVPGILFERQFVSASNSNGKGSVAFWSSPSASVYGAFSVAAWNADTETAVPIAQFGWNPSSVAVKWFAPVRNDDVNLGLSTNAWKNGYFVNAPQVVSDARLKSPVRSLNANELSAAWEIAKEIGVFTWLRPSADRLHIGMTVQRAIEIMESHGLSPFDYSFICYEEWSDEYEDVYAPSETEKDDAGEPVMEVVGRRLVREAGSTYGFKDGELMKFIAAGFAARLAALEA